MPSELGQRPYNLYRSRPRGVRALLRGEEQPFLPGRDLDGGGRGAPPGRRRGLLRGGLTWKRGLAYLAIAILAWLLLSVVLFLVSADTGPGIPADAQAALSSGPNMVTGTDTVLILGTDQRPRTGPGSKEPGSNYNDAGANSDTIMLWRIGGGVSRRLSIPRDTLAQIPGHGQAKINAAYAIGGPALTIKTIEQFASQAGVPISINHVIIVNFAAFPQFIDAIGGVDVTTGRVCANISGGTANGGFTLNFRPGTHHLSGLQALLYARIRENPCNPKDNDLTRVQHQQQILNAIKAKLFTVGTFFRLPWASWDAPKVVRTDMGGFTLLSLFAASELGGSAPVKVVGSINDARDVPGLGSVLELTPSEVHAALTQLMNG